MHIKRIYYIYTSLEMYLTYCTSTFEICPIEIMSLFCDGVALDVRNLFPANECNKN